VKEEVKKDEGRRTRLPRPTEEGAANTQVGYKTYSATGRSTLYALKHNLYVCDEGTPADKATQLTKDGEENYSFAAAGSAAWRGKGAVRRKGGTTTARPERPPDRANVTGHRLEGVLRHPHRLANIKSCPRIRSPRRAEARTVRLPVPGEENIRKTELFTYDAEKRRSPRSIEWKDER